MTRRAKIRVLVKLFASHQVGRFKEAVVEYPEGFRIGDTLNRLGIAEKSIGVAIVNSERVPLDRPLRHGDTLALFPLIAGG